MAGFAAVIPIGRKHQQRGPVFDRAILRTARHLGPERVGNVRDDETKQTGAAGPHADGEIVALIADGTGRIENPLARLVRDIGRAGECPAGGALGHPCLARDVNDRRPPPLHQTRPPMA
ncbi:hypothetical protein D3C86_1847430 [compost metagenome]